MVLGMGVVFVFLLLLVFAVRGMSIIALRLQPPQIAAPVPRPSAASELGEAELAAVIAAAVKRYRAGS